MCDIITKLSARSGERDRSLKIEQQEIKKYKAKKHSAKESRNSERKKYNSNKSKKAKKESSIMIEAHTERHAS